MRSLDAEPDPVVAQRRRLVDERLRCLPCQMATSSGATAHRPCSGAELLGGGHCACECRR